MRRADYEGALQQDHRHGPQAGDRRCLDDRADPSGALRLTSEDEARDKYTIVGTACESTDVFDENVTLRKTRRGDLLTIKSAGAYGMSMASRYNLHDLPGAVYSDEIQ